MLTNLIKTYFEEESMVNRNTPRWHLRITFDANDFKTLSLVSNVLCIDVNLKSHIIQNQ